MAQPTCHVRAPNLYSPVVGLILKYSFPAITGRLHIPFPINTKTKLAVLMAQKCADNQEDSVSNAPADTSVNTSLSQAEEERLRCRYSNKKCLNHRTQKRVGGLHAFCEEHRDNANRNQRKLDQRKRTQRRRQQSLQTYYETIQATTQQVQVPHADRGTTLVTPYPSAMAIAVEPCTRPAQLLEEDLDVLVSLFDTSAPHPSGGGDHYAL